MAGISCPSCGGKMVFDIPKQALKCVYCGTLKDIDDYDQDNQAEEHKETYSAMVFTCKNCGAELIAPDEQTVAYCSYCGSEQMLDGKYEDVIRPKTIIPFQKSKKQAKNEYEKALKGKFFVPKEFKEADFIEGFRGIYLPYYSFEASIPERDLELTAHKDFTRGRYDYHEEYDIKAKIGGRTSGVKYDASIAFDDTIANEIAPFRAGEERDYKDAYLAGFYADKATTPVSTYIEYATEDAVDNVIDEISKAAGNVKLDDVGSYEKKKQLINIDSFHCDVSLYPLWFLTWRHKDRVAYSVMNGQTGKVSADIPVDKKKFFLISLIIAAALFVVLSLLPMFILPKTIAVISAIILVVSGVIFKSEIRNIFVKEAHIYDYGDIARTEKKKRIRVSEEKKAKTKSGASAAIGCGVAIFVYFGVFLVAGIVSCVRSISSGITGSAAFIFFFAVTFIIHVILSFFIAKDTFRLERKTAFIPALFAPMALFFGILVGIFNPAHDYWYYGVTLACLVALVLNSLSCVNYFNYLTTRPVPNYFRREGADNETD